MKLLGKNIDTLHQVLFGILVLGVLMFIGVVLQEGEENPTEKNIELLQAITQADFALMSGDFDKAELAYIQISKQYPQAGKLELRMKMVTEKRERHSAFVSLQDELNNNVETIGNLESYMIIIEERNENLRQIQHAENTLTGENTLGESNSKMNGVDKSGIESNARVKDILDIINYDGSEIKYIGEIEDGKANGFGFAVFSKKGFYEGHWANNMRNGKGIYYWQNGDTYEGAYVNGKREGLGTYTFASGEVYVGHWKNNLRNGEGELTNKKGKLVFKGKWSEDEPVPGPKRKR